MQKVDVGNFAGQMSNISANPERSFWEGFPSSYPKGYLVQAQHLTLTPQPKASSPKLGNKSSQPPALQTIAQIQKINVAVFLQNQGETNAEATLEQTYAICVAAGFPVKGTSVCLAQPTLPNPKTPYLLCFKGSCKPAGEFCIHFQSPSTPPREKTSFRGYH